MNKEKVIKNLKNVFAKEELLEKIRQVCLETQALREEAENNLRDARGFLRKSIEKAKEIYANIDGKDYKIMPFNHDKFDVAIEEIELIK